MSTTSPAPRALVRILLPEGRSARVSGENGLSTTLCCALIAQPPLCRQEPPL
ncbi:MAG: hypothetical protein M3Y73_10805 [Actinomycetota bacterium]|nr:hypothetical protein [Actinomycetota bacterium]